MARKPASKPTAKPGAARPKKPKAKPATASPKKSAIKITGKPIAKAAAKSTARTTSKSGITAAAVPSKRISLTPLKKGQFILKDAGAIPPKTQPVEELFLSDFVAAIRRELEAVALIAASDDKEVPQLHLSEVNLDFSYAVSSVTSDGVLIKVKPEQLADASAKGVQRIGLKLTDIDVVSATDLAIKTEKPRK